jgi:hypothetical protein
VDVQISAAKHDQGTAHVVEIIAPHLVTLQLRLSGNYGGSMEHLWIDLELCPADADNRAPWPFRFQKRVTPPRELRALKPPTYFNVGHYSVRPDYFVLARVPQDQVAGYLLQLLYKSTDVLEQKRRTLGKFDVDAFRARFRNVLQEMGCASASTAS